MILKPEYTWKLKFHQYLQHQHWERRIISKYFIEFCGQREPEKGIVPFFIVQHYNEAEIQPACGRQKIGITIRII